MPIKVGINGYGRIGRNMLRALYEGKRTHEIQIVAINDLCDAQTNAHLTRYDTVHGKFPGEVKRRRRRHGRERRSHPRARGARSRPSCPGARSAPNTFSSAPDSSPARPRRGAHLKGGAKKVVISAPGGEDVDATIVYGVNHHVLKSLLHRDLQRLLHHQLPRAGRQGAARQGRHRRRPHDDDPLLHQRSGADRRLPLRSAPRALGDHVADPDQDRRRRRRRPGDAGAQGQARRLFRARADDQRLARGPHVQRRSAPPPSRRSTRLCSRPPPARSRASSPTTMRRWCRSTSITTRTRRSSTRRSPR